MKTINKKGFTVIELILSFSFVMIISLGMFSILTSYRERQLMISLESDMKSFQNNITTVIQNDITDDVLEKAEYCSGPMGNNPDCVVLYFKNGAAKKLEIKTAQYTDEDGNDFEGKYISYDGIIYEPKEQQFVNFKPDFILEWTPIDTNLTVYKFNVPVFHEDLDGNYGLKITATGINRKEESQTLEECFATTPGGTITVFQKDDPVCAVTNLVIPSTIRGIVVTGIGTRVFEDIGLSSVSIPPDVTYIGSYAFKNNQISSLNISEGLKNIHMEAFSNNKLSSLVIPSSVTTIRERAFMENELTSLILSENLTTVSNRAFANNLLTSIILPPSLTEIGSAMFHSNKLTSINIPNTVTSIGGAAFYGNELTSLTLPPSVTTIGTLAFQQNKISSLTLTPNLTDISNSAFYNNLLTSVVIPEGVTRIGVSTFGYNRLTSVTLPTSLTEIDTNAFNNNRLSSFTVPPNITKITNSSLGNNLLTEMTIPAYVNEIGNYAFSNNPLGTITIKRANADGMILGEQWNGTGTVVFSP